MQHPQSYPIANRKIKGVRQSNIGPNKLLNFSKNITQEFFKLELNANKIKRPKLINIINIYLKNTENE